MCDGIDDLKNMGDRGDYIVRHPVGSRLSWSYLRLPIGRGCVLFGSKTFLGSPGGTSRKDREDGEVLRGWACLVLAPYVSMTFPCYPYLHEPK